VEITKLNDSCYRISGYDSASTEREAAEALSADINKAMMEILRPLGDAEFTAKMEELAKELS
jgi:hypothetical protein